MFLLQLYLGDEEGLVGLAKFETIEECFHFLRKRGHKVERASLTRITEKDLELAKRGDLTIAYASASTLRTNRDIAPFQSLQKQNTKFIFITEDTNLNNSKGSFSYDSLISCHASWSRWNIVHKIFHPGNSLTLAVILTAVGIGLIGFGVACPPALVFVALGFAAFSAISAIGYAIDWLKRDWNYYKAGRQAEIDKGGHHGIQPTFSHYISQYPSRLIAWAKTHKPQAIMMGIGAVVFLGALAVVAGHFIAIAITGAGFAFMTMGASGGALGLTSSFFAAGFVAINGLTASVAAALTSAFAAMALALGPTNILDSIRRLAGGVYKRFFDKTEVVSNEPDAPQFDAPPAVFPEVKMTFLAPEDLTELGRKRLGGGEPKFNISVFKKPQEEQVDKLGKKTPYRYGRIDIDESDIEGSDFEKNSNASRNTTSDDEVREDEESTRLNVAGDLFGERNNEEGKGYKKSRVFSLRGGYASD